MGEDIVHSRNKDLLSISFLLERERKLPFLLLASISFTARYVQCSLFIRMGQLDCIDSDISTDSTLHSYHLDGRSATECLQASRNSAFISVRQLNREFTEQRFMNWRHDTRVHICPSAWGISVTTWTASARKFALRIAIWTNKFYFTSRANKSRRKGLLSCLLENVI